MHFSDTMGTPGTDDDATSPTITLNVKDVEGVSVATGTATADDWKPTITAPSSVVQGVAMTASLDLTSVTTVDSRGSSSGKGVLGDAIAAGVDLSFTGTGLSSADVALGASVTTVTATAVSKVYTPVRQCASGSVAVGAGFDSDAGGTYTDLTGGASISTAVTSNGVTGYADDLAVTAVTGRSRPAPTRPPC